MEQNRITPGARKTQKKTQKKLKKFFRHAHTATQYAKDKNPTNTAQTQDIEPTLHPTQETPKHKNKKIFCDLRNGQKYDTMCITSWRDFTRVFSFQYKQTNKRKNKGN